jgi:hypothetical protein
MKIIKHPGLSMVKYTENYSMKTLENEISNIKISINILFSSNECIRLMKLYSNLSRNPQSDLNIYL